MKVYLDDARETPPGWSRTFTIHETQELLATRQVTHLSLDNDLGSEDHRTEGYNVLNWLEEQVFLDHSFPIPIIYIHSSNQGRAPQMKQVASKLDQIRLRQEDGY